MLFYFIILLIVLLLLFLIFSTDNSSSISFEDLHNSYQEQFSIDNNYAFTKSLRHDENLLCNKQDYQEFMQCLTHKKLDMNYFGNMKMVSISSSFNRKYDSLFENMILPFQDKLISNLDNDMIELYAMSLCRDVPFKDYESNELVINASKELNQSIDILFRATHDTGFYISQFIYYPHKFMGNTIEQKYKQYIIDKDYGTTEEEIINMQNGFIRDKQQLQNIETYVRTARDLAKYVYVDNPLVYGQIIFSILSNLGVPLKFNSTNEQLFIDSGIIDFQALSTEVARIAMIKCWQVKYKYCLLRPEAYAFHFNQFKQGKSTNYNFSDKLINSESIINVFKKQNNYLLSQTYVEGSPCHPSYTSGHSTFIGAIVTIFKAFYNEDFEIDELIPNDDGTQLIKTGNKVKIGDELNKLASNVSIGRSFAGVHYRMDGDGLYIGQEVAINYLRERSKEYKEIKGLNLIDLDGKQRII